MVRGSPADRNADVGALVASAGFADVVSLVVRTIGPETVHDVALGPLAEADRLVISRIEGNRRKEVGDQVPERVRDLAEVGVAVTFNGARDRSTPEKGGDVAVLGRGDEQALGEGTGAVSIPSARLHGEFRFQLEQGVAPVLSGVHAGDPDEFVHGAEEMLGIGAAGPDGLVGGLGKRGPDKVGPWGHGCGLGEIDVLGWRLVEQVESEGTFGDERPGKGLGLVCVEEGFLEGGQLEAGERSQVQHVFGPHDSDGEARGAHEPADQDGFLVEGSGKTHGVEDGLGGLVGLVDGRGVGCPEGEREDPRLDMGEVRDAEVGDPVGDDDGVSEPLRLQRGVDVGPPVGKAVPFRCGPGQSFGIPAPGAVGQMSAVHAAQTIDQREHAEGAILRGGYGSDPCCELGGGNGFAGGTDGLDPIACAVR